MEKVTSYQSARGDLGDAIPAQGGDGEFSALPHVLCGEILRDHDTALDLRRAEVGRVGEEFVVCLFGARLGGRHVEGRHCPHLGTCPAERRSM